MKSAVPHYTPHSAAPHTRATQKPPTTNCQPTAAPRASHTVKQGKLHCRVCRPLPPARTPHHFVPHAHCTSCTCCTVHMLHFVPHAHCTPYICCTIHMLYIVHHAYCTSCTCCPVHMLYTVSHPNPHHTCATTLQKGTHPHPHTHVPTHARTHAPTHAPTHARTHALLVIPWMQGY